jgi:glycosyltransferase involved in cell wall biosynthesis
MSGLTSFAALLTEVLAKRIDIELFACCDSSVARDWSLWHKYTVHAVRAPYWINVIRKIYGSEFNKILVISGIHKSRLLGPVFLPLLAVLHRNRRLILYQGVNLDRPLGVIGRWLLSKFDALACNSPLLTSQLPKGNTYVPPGIDLDSIKHCQAMPKGRKFSIGYFNHLNKTKGCDIALQAFAASARADTEFLVGGTGKMEYSLRSRYDGQHGIRFLGHLPDPILGIKACDAMVLPFRTATSVLGISQTVLECLAAGVPIIGSRSEAIISAVEHEKEGLIFENSEDLVRCIYRIRDEPGLRERLSGNALLKAGRFNITDVALKIETLLQETNL